MYLCYRQPLLLTENKNVVILMDVSPGRTHLGLFVVGTLERRGVGLHHGEGDPLGWWLGPVPAQSPLSYGRSGNKERSLWTSAWRGISKLLFLLWRFSFKFNLPANDGKLS